MSLFIKIHKSIHGLPIFLSTSVFLGSVSVSYVNVTFDTDALICFPSWLHTTLELNFL